MFQVLNTNDRAKRSNFRVPNKNGRAKRSNFRVPNKNGRAKRSNFRVPNKNGRAKRSNFRVPNKNGRAKRSNFRVLNTNGRAKRSNFRVLNTNGRVKRSNFRVKPPVPLPALLTEQPISLHAAVLLLLTPNPTVIIRHRPLYFRAGETPTLQESCLDSAMPPIKKLHAALLLRKGSHFFH
ncbi:hypothetical protein NSTCB13_07287 [Nostoc sp. DSM 114160]